MDEENLEARIQKLEQWMADRTTQQITFPLDVQSINILTRYFLAYVSNLDFTNSSGFVFGNIIIQQNGRQYTIGYQNDLIRYSVDAGTDVLTIGLNITNGIQGAFMDHDKVILNSTGDLPTPLVDNVPYYVVSANGTGTQIQLALTDGGLPIDITDVGNGQQFISSS